MSTNGTGFLLEEVRIENVKNIRLLALSINGRSTRITGDNGAGKTAFFDAVKWCIGGRGKPISDGATRCEVELTLVDGTKAKLEVKRTATRDGAPRVEVMLNGESQSSPQKFLDALKATLAFNPMTFDDLCETAEGRRRQRDILAEISGVKTRLEELEAARKNLYDQRTTANADVRSAEAAVLAVPPVRPDTPDEPVNIAELQAKSRALQDRRLAAAKWERDRAEAGAKRTRIYNELATLAEEIKRLKEKHEASQNAFSLANKEVIEFPAGPAMPSSDEAQAIEKAITDASAVNSAVQRKKLKAKAKARHDAAERKAKDLDAAIRQVEDDKRLTVEQAVFPVEGLAFDDDGVIYQGRRYEDWNRAKRAEISTGITIHQNSGLNLILMDDADGIGEEIKLAIVTKAEEHKKQVLFGVYQKVAGPIGIHIEFGAVVSVDGKERSA